VFQCPGMREDGDEFTAEQLARIAVFDTQRLG